MAAFIALYRGLNVVGKNMVAMESLRALHERLGHSEPASYIQSGNIVFAAKGSAPAIARKLADAFLREYGFAAKVLVLDAKQLSAIVASNPYARAAADSPKTVHLGVCEGAPSEVRLTALLARTGGREHFTIGAGVVYVHAPDGYGTSKFCAGLERAAGVPMTVRNWRTVQTLLEMVNAVGD